MQRSSEPRRAKRYRWRDDGGLAEDPSPVTRENRRVIDLTDRASALRASTQGADAPTDPFLCACYIRPRRTAKLRQRRLRPPFQSGGTIFHFRFIVFAPVFHLSTNRIDGSRRRGRKKLQHRLHHLGYCRRLPQVSVNCRLGNAELIQLIRPEPCDAGYRVGFCGPSYPGGKEPSVHSPSATGIKVTQYSDRGFDLPPSRFGLDSTHPNLLGASLDVV